VEQGKVGVSGVIGMRGCFDGAPTIPFAVGGKRDISKAKTFTSHKEVHFDINLEPRIEEDILQKAKEIASQNGVSVEKLINQWLRERIEAYAA